MNRSSPLLTSCDFLSRKNIDFDFVYNLETFISLLYRLSDFDLFVRKNYRIHNWGRYWFDNSIQDANIEFWKGVHFDISILKYWLFVYTNRNWLQFSRFKKWWWYLVYGNIRVVLTTFTTPILLLTCLWCVCPFLILLMSKKFSDVY